MMKTFFSLIILLIITGCTAGSSELKQSAVLRGYRDIAVIQFACPDAAVGQKTAGKIAHRFASRGFNIIDQGKLKKLADEERLSRSGLSEADKSALGGGGIKAVVFGVIEKYACEGNKAWTWTGRAPRQVEQSTCHASLSLKMVDTGSGKTLWEAYDSDSEDGEGMTAKTVLGIVLSRIEDKIPAIRQ